jgi:hypothetical protein
VSTSTAAPVLLPTMGSEGVESAVFTLWGPSVRGVGSAVGARSSVIESGGGKLGRGIGGIRATWLLCGHCGGGGVSHWVFCEQQKSKLLVSSIMLSDMWSSTLKEFCSSATGQPGSCRICEGSSGEIAFFAAVGAKDVSLESIFAKEKSFVERLRNC